MTYTHTDTDFALEKEYPKLVRDRIPEIVGTGPEGNFSFETLADDETYLRALLKKIREEAEELSHAESDDNLQEEMADVFEVIYAILKLKGWTIEDIIAIQKEKRAERGGFDKRLLMIKK